MKRPHTIIRFGHRTVQWVALGAALLWLAGCSSNQYEIELKPDGESVERSLTCWNVGSTPAEEGSEGSEYGAFSEEELQRIAAAYGAPVPKKLDQKHTFLKRFSGPLPSDLGGSGSYTHWTNALGSTSAYIERLRGNDDLLDAIEQRMKAADRATDLLIGWLQEELGDQPPFGPLRNFLDGEFRHDLKNLSMYVWTITLSAEENEVSQQEGIVRAGQYLVDRNYFKAEDLPAWGRALNDDAQSEQLLGLVRKMVANKTGIGSGDKLPAHLRFLSDPVQLQKSLNEFLRDTDEYRATLEKWKQGDHPPDAPEPEPVDSYVDLLISAFLPGLALGPSDQVRVKLAAANEPFLTNGKWDAEEGGVLWSRGMPQSSEQTPGVPQVLFAVWSEPNEQLQRQRFGEIVLTGQSLGEYCFWYAGLSPAEAKEWNTFVASLKPGKELVRRVRKFRFSFEPPANDEEQHDDLSAIPRGLILARLDEDEDSTDQ